MSVQTCSVRGCSRPRHARGWCQLHYKRWYRTGNSNFDESGQLEPRFGPYADLKFDVNGKAICHFCGGSYDLVGLHAGQAHGISSAEYRERCGLSEAYPLCSKAFSESHRDALTNRREQNDPTLMDPTEIWESALAGSRAKAGTPKRESARRAQVKGIYEYWSDQSHRHASPQRQRTTVATEGITCLACGVLFTPIDFISRPTGRVMVVASTNRRTCSMRCRIDHMTSLGLRLASDGKARITSAFTSSRWAGSDK